MLVNETILDSSESTNIVESLLGQGTGSSCQLRDGNPRVALGVISYTGVSMLSQGRNNVCAVHTQPLANRFSPYMFPLTDCIKWFITVSKLPYYTINWRRTHYNYMPGTSERIYAAPVQRLFALYGPFE